MAAVAVRWAMEVTSRRSSRGRQTNARLGAAGLSAACGPQDCPSLNVNSMRGKMRGFLSSWKRLGLKFPLVDTEAPVLLYAEVGKQVVDPFVVLQSPAELDVLTFLIPLGTIEHTVKVVVGDQG